MIKINWKTVFLIPSAILYSTAIGFGLGWKVFSTPCLVQQVYTLPTKEICLPDNDKTVAILKRDKLGRVTCEKHRVTWG